MKYTIAVIGAGQLGSRHLQGLAVVDKNLEIFLVDPSDTSLSVSLERHGQVDVEGAQKVHLLNSIESLPEHLDLTIIACTADVRYEALAELLKHSKVDKIILEKVLFQDLEHYKNVLSLGNISENNVWVNFAQRLWPFFIELKEKLADDPLLEINITGSNWGLGCNSVHNVDLAAFLWKQKSVTTAHIDKELIPSKRPRFVEFSGEIVTDVNGGGRVRQICYPDGNSPFVISVTHPLIKQHWDVTNGILYTSNESNDWGFEKSDLIPPYQSNLTTNVVEDILSDKDCGLPKLGEACVTHVDTIEAILTSTKSSGNDFGKVCPIT